MVVLLEDSPCFFFLVQSNYSAPEQVSRLCGKILLTCSGALHVQMRLFANILCFLDLETIQRLHVIPSV